MRFPSLTIILLSLTLLTILIPPSLLSPLETKRLLMIIFPGGTSHHFVIKSLFDYTVSHQDKFTYEYHMIIHNIDKKNWEAVSSHPNYHLYHYGDIAQCKEHLINSIAMFNSNPNFGFMNFNKGMKYHIKEFMESGILNKLKHIHFDTIGSDIPTYIQVILAKELSIKNKIYISPPAIPQILYRNFELNPSYTPAVGAKFLDEMLFKERILNYIYQNAAKLIFTLFQKEQANYVKSNYGYDVGTTIHFTDALHFLQYPLGIAFPLSTPPNFVLLNAITPKDSLPMNQSDINIDTFLSKYEHNVYLSQGTIMDIVDINKQINVFKYFANKGNVGFVLSMRADVLSESAIKQMPSNVYVTHWVNQNDLLGDERIKCFVTHGGINSVAESIYHNKPMVVLGVGLDQINTAAYVKKKNIGITVQEQHLVTEEFLVSSIEDILINNKEYVNRINVVNNVMKYSKDPKEEFKFWIDFGFANGYDALVIDTIKNGNWFIVNGYDVQLVFVGVVVLFMYIIISIYRCLYWYFCAPCESKKGQKRKKHKFD